MPTKEIGGELEVRLTKGVSLIEVPGKEQLGFQYDLQRYDNEGKIASKAGPVQVKRADPESGVFKARIKLTVKNNMNTYHNAIKIACCRLDSEATTATFPGAEKEPIGCIFVMWKECAEKAQDGLS